MKLILLCSLLIGLMACNEQRVQDRLPGSVERDTDAVMDTLETKHLSKKEKRKRRWKKFGRSLGKGMVATSREMTKGFTHTSAFFKGLSQKKSSPELVGFYDFFIENEKVFWNVMNESRDVDSFQENIRPALANIIEQKALRVAADVLHEAGILKVPLKPDASKEEITRIIFNNLDKIDNASAIGALSFRLTPDFINNHKEVRTLKPFIGDLSWSQLREIVLERTITMDRDIEPDVIFKSLLKDGKKDLLISSSVGVATSFLIPQITLSAIFWPLGVVNAAVMLPSMITTGVLAKKCVDKAQREEFEEGSEIDEFCHYVVVRSFYEVFRSNAKGYLKGYRARMRMKATFAKWKKNRQERRQKRLMRREQRKEKRKERRQKMKIKHKARMNKIKNFFRAQGA